MPSLQITTLPNRKSKYLAVYYEKENLTAIIARLSVPAEEFIAGLNATGLKIKLEKES